MPGTIGDVFNYGQGAINAYQAGDYGGAVQQGTAAVQGGLQLGAGATQGTNSSIVLGAAGTGAGVGAAVGAGVGVVGGPVGVAIGGAIGAVVGLLAGIIGGSVAANNETSPVDLAEAAAQAAAAHQRAVAYAKQMLAEIRAGVVQVREATTQQEAAAAAFRNDIAMGFKTGVVNISFVTPSQYQVIQAWAAQMPGLDPLSYLQDPTVRERVRKELAARGIFLSDAEMVAAYRQGLARAAVYAQQLVQQINAGMIQIRQPQTDAELKTIGFRTMLGQDFKPGTVKLTWVTPAIAQSLRQLAAQAPGGVPAAAPVQKKSALPVVLGLGGLAGLAYLFFV